MKVIFISVLLASAAAFSQNRSEVYFEFDRYDLEPSEQQKLDSWIASNPNAEVSGVYGYCDHIGTLEYNDDLSLKRANTVAEYLKSHEIAFSEKFEIKGYGESFEQTSPRNLNRKVEIAYSFSEGKKPEIPAEETFGKKIVEGKVGEKIKLPGLNFYNMSDVVVPNSRPVLYELLKILRENPKLKVEIQGHICCQTAGEPNYTQVSVMRAKAVYDFLVRNQIDRERLSYKGFGTTKPLHPIPEKNEQERDENRRVEVEIISN